MNLESIDGISLRGFSEPVSVQALRETKCHAIPDATGVYLILRMSDCVPEFLQKSTGGAFKGKDPTCLTEVVRRKWNPGARVVYVGKAAGRKGLRGRVYDLIAFGYGEPVGHWGGRLLWHLPDKEKLSVLWRCCPASQADEEETRAINDFKMDYAGNRPFANLTK